MADDLLRTLTVMSQAWPNSGAHDGSQVTTTDTIEQRML
jgi:hypothetical protein